MSALARHPEFSSDMRYRTAAINDPLNKQQAAMNGEASISVGHEDLRGR